MFLAFLNKSFIFTFLMLFSLIYQAGIEYDLLSLIYVFTISFYYYFIIFIISIPFWIFVNSSRLLFLVVLPKSIFDFFLLINLFVFNLYQFHIDLMFINMAIYDFKGMGISPIYIFVVFLLFMAILIGNLWILKTSKKVKLITLLIPFMILILGQSIHIYGDFFKKDKIIKYTPYVPYYLPLTSYSHMSDYFERPTIGEKIFKENKGIFKYPLKKIEFNSNNPKPNILFFVLESWRYDMLSDEITPHMMNFSKGSYLFKDHYSGGSVTVAGIFSLMYGLSANYMNFAKAQPYRFQSVFTKSLEQNGYDIEVYTASNFNRFALREMLFGNIKNEKFYDEGEDEDMANIFHTNTKSPWFKFVFLTSSHYSYHYPDKFKKFKPTPINDTAFLLDKYTEREPFINDYKNSLLYMDSLFEKIISKIKDKNTIIVITSDHGEEFNENNRGFWTHGNNFTKWQIKVPLILRMPNQTKSKIINHRTSHLDIVPTVLEYMQIKNNIKDYSSGVNLLNDKKRLLVIQSYKTKAYLIDDIVYTTGIKFKRYNIHDMDIVNDKYHYKEINEIRKGENNFLDL